MFIDYLKNLINSNKIATISSIHIELSDEAIKQSGFKHFKIEDESYNGEKTLTFDDKVYTINNMKTKADKKEFKHIYDLTIKDYESIMKEIENKNTITDDFANCALYGTYLRAHCFYQFITGKSPDLEHPIKKHNYNSSYIKNYYATFKYDVKYLTEKKNLY